MRYLPLTPDDRAAMLSAIGASSIDDLFVDVPESARLDAPVDLPRVQGELEVEAGIGVVERRPLGQARCQPQGFHGIEGRGHSPHVGPSQRQSQPVGKEMR